jgi:hypothetical protein
MYTWMCVWDESPSVSSRAYSPIPQSLFLWETLLYLCYIDESGTSDIPGNTSHFVLAGLSIPIWHWKEADSSIDAVKRKYGLDGTEIHTAWMMRRFLEQTKIPKFESLSFARRRKAVQNLRHAELLRLQRSKAHRQYNQTKKNYVKTSPYIHLTYEERSAFIRDVAQCVAGWESAVLFAECIDKIHFDSRPRRLSVGEQAFEQLVSRFEYYLKNRSSDCNRSYGLLIHDNNETVSTKHTRLMREYHRTGTLWTKLECIIETPLFVDSQLTSMVQVADLCSYALRRYVENGEAVLFDLVFERADRRAGIAVGVRHFAPSNCRCRICASHRQAKQQRRKA